MKNALFLIGALVLVFAVELLAGVFTQASVQTWYQTVVKPAWTPPAWVFGPVWTALYAMMAVALFLVWRKGGSGIAYFFWGLQLALNLAWSYLFFTLQSPLLGLIDLSALWVAVLITTLVFFRHSRAAGWLMVPYFLWVSYALSLNAAIWVLN